jgi:hypothetical protein
MLFLHVSALLRGHHQVKYNLDAKIAQGYKYLTTEKSKISKSE